MSVLVAPDRWKTTSVEEYPSTIIYPNRMGNRLAKPMGTSLLFSIYAPHCASFFAMLKMYMWRPTCFSITKKVLHNIFMLQEDFGPWAAMGYIDE